MRRRASSTPAPVRRPMPAGSCSLPSTADRITQRLGRAPGPVDLYEPGTSIALGTYLGQLSTDQRGDWIRIVAALQRRENAPAKLKGRFGHQAPDVLVESITFRETRDYVKRVISHHRRYRQTYAAGFR